MYSSHAAKSLSIERLIVRHNFPSYLLRAPKVMSISNPHGSNNDVFLSYDVYIDK